MRVVFTPDFRGNPYQRILATSLEALGASVEFLPGRARLRDLLADPPDVLHLHWERPWTVSDSMREAVRWTAELLRDLVSLRRHGVRIVWTLHNLRDHDAPHPRIERLAQIIIARLAHRVVVHYPAAVVLASRWLFIRDAKFDVMLHGPFDVASDTSRSDARRVLGVPQDAVVLASVGFIRRYKRVPETIAAVRSSGGDSTRLVVAGQARGEERDRVARAAAESPSILLLLDRQTDEQLSTVLVASDAVMVVSGEQFASSTALLAMSHGCAVVATRTPHVAFLCGDEGAVYVEDASTDALSDTIRELSPEPLRAMGERNVERALSFSWEEAASALLDSYGERSPYPEKRTPD